MGMVKPESGDDWIYVNRCKPNPETTRPELGENLCYKGHSGAMKRLIPAFSSIQTSERLTLDSLVFALIKSRRPPTFLKAVLRPDHALILSEPIIDEFSRVTADEKIKRHGDDEAAAAYLGQGIAQRSTRIGEDGSGGRRTAESVPCAHAGAVGRRANRA